MRNTLILSIAAVLLIASGFFVYTGFRERAIAAPPQTTPLTKANEEAISPEVRSLALAMLDQHDSDQDVIAYMRQMRPLAKTPMDQKIVAQFGTFLDQSDAYNRFRAQAAIDRRECAALTYDNERLREYGEKPVGGNCTQTVNNEIAAAKQANEQAMQAIQNVMNEVHQNSQQ